ncbi:phosphoglycerate kinase [Stieleria sp. TO1_6]|uniref:phosphoglycerate kinase n=1 Tax=Stieleria tagensis TaxID=2956795 RepID=UPI00209B7E02|nr:phosphoglycerate kinase [Stieleria tagensis]MCO8122885.1 phosphoglycerate kinase [Stieleria tagensis]
MGLDMYAMATKEKIDRPVDFKVTEASQIFYWRKHPDLHGWMEQLYYIKGGQEPFNCVPVALDESDLDRLEKELCNEDLPSTSGPFFGVSTDHDKEDDLAFIAKARHHIGEGYTVFYDSWW